MFSIFSDAGRRMLDSLSTRAEMLLFMKDHVLLMTISEGLGENLALTT